MSGAKQWIANKVVSTKRGELHPFDGFLYSENNSTYFQFSSPGLIGGKIPNNMWSNAKSLFKTPVSNTAKWYIVASCLVRNGIVTSITLKMTSGEPSPPSPVKGGMPTSIDVILWVGVGNSSPYKMFNGNITIKTVIVQRSYKSVVECGISNYEDWYTLAAVL